MRTKILLIGCCLILCFISSRGMVQDLAVKDSTIKTIWDIPHKTIWQKWMWIHRSFAFQITKDRPVNYDTAYIKSYYKRLVVTLPVSTRFLKFSLIDTKTGNKLVFAPNLQYNLGISISSRWASFIANTGVKLFGNDIEIKGKTKYQDFQLNLYGRKFTTDMFVQHYDGFYIKNSQSFNNYRGDNKYAIRNDVSAVNMGVNSYYILNNKKVSFGNSFSFVEQQKKSAGSLLLGVYYSYFSASGSPSLVSAPFKDDFDSLSFIRSARTHNFGFNLGYIYTLVFLKKCYVTASLVQGIGAQQMSYVRDNNSTFHQLIGGAGKLNVRVAMGYDNGRYFIGTMGMFNYYLFTGKTNSTIDSSFGKFMIYVGYRFSILKAERKSLRHFKLIGY